MSNPTSNRASGALMLLLATSLTACGNAGSSASPATQSTAGTARLDRCALLTDEEITAAIGPHDGGRVGDLERLTLWGSEGCRWTALAVREIAGYGNWSDAIEVAVFDKTRESWHRAQAEGEPVEGLGEGALYNENTGELWFDCGAGRFCAIKAHTASSRGRQELAERLARIVQGRMSRR